MRRRDHVSGQPAATDLRPAADRGKRVVPNARRGATHDDFAVTQIATSVEQTHPGSPLDETSTKAKAPEPWVTKLQLAEYLGVTRRWIELQQHLGLPYLRMVGMNRYCISEVETWLRKRYTATADPGASDAI